jgi:hypothetical protein
VSVKCNSAVLSFFGYPNALTLWRNIVAFYSYRTGQKEIVIGSNRCCFRHIGTVIAS